MIDALVVISTPLRCINVVELLFFYLEHIKVANHKPSMYDKFNKSVLRRMCPKGAKTRLSCIPT